MAALSCSVKSAIRASSFDMPTALAVILVTVCALVCRCVATSADAVADDP